MVREIVHASCSCKLSERELRRYSQHARTVVPIWTPPVLLALDEKAVVRDVQERE